MREISKDTLKGKLQILNPHWTTGSIEANVKKHGRREYFQLLYPLIKTSTVNRAVILLGPRRVGKTILLLQTIQQLITDKVDPKKILYLSIDTPLLQGLALDALIDLYKEIHGFDSIEGCYIIFDEIQYLHEWEVHLKALVDQHKTSKFIGSGSAAAALRRKSQESGAGRFTDFMLPPITFYEFLRLLNLEKAALADIKEMNNQFIRYMNFGGYPEAVFNTEIQQNPERFVRSDIIEKALLRDLPSLYGIQDIQELTQLFNALAYQTGNEVTLDGLSQSSGIAKNTIKKYIDYLQSAFLIKTVSRVGEDGKNFKRKNFFKVYLTNCSMYAALIEPVTERCEAIGHLVETAIVSQLMHDTSGFVRTMYARWSDKGGQGEVDLVNLNERLHVAGALEVKWSDSAFNNPQDLRGLMHFTQHCKLPTSVVTTKTLSGFKDQANGHRIYFHPSAFVCYSFGKFIIERKHALQHFLQTQGEVNTISSDPPL